MYGAANRAAYFNESSEALGTPQGHSGLKAGRYEDDGVAPAPVEAELGCQRTRITIVTAPTARKQHKQAALGPQISNSQDAFMF